MRYRQIAVTAILLLLFAVIGTALVAVTYEGTAERIAANEREALQRSLNKLIPAAAHDNDMLTDTIQVREPNLLGTTAPVMVYRARQQGAPVAAVLTPVAPDGYSGSIKLLVGINTDGTLAGVRVVAHRETPGLGDFIEEERSNWILKFSGRSLDNPPSSGWKVKRDGGVFDQFTGATITPRAVVQAVHNCLLYFADHRQALFAPAESAAATLNGH